MVSRTHHLINVAFLGAGIVCTALSSNQEKIASVAKRAMEALSSYSSPESSPFPFKGEKKEVSDLENVRANRFRPTNYIDLDEGDIQSDPVAEEKGKKRGL